MRVVEDGFYAGPDERRGRGDDHLFRVSDLQSQVEGRLKARRASHSHEDAPSALVAVIAIAVPVLVDTTTLTTAELQLCV